MIELHVTLQLNGKRCVHYNVFLAEFSCLHFMGGGGEEYARYSK